MSGRDTIAQSMFTLAIRTVSLSRGRSPLSAELPYGVTGVEQQLLQLLSTGKTYHEIAVDLGVNRDTVAMRLYRIFRKLDVTNSAGAVAVALRKGIIK